ncbi:DNA topology modulation protein [Pelagicoccus mobilis]|uniref:DNA topology modulation protein n=1 Tax=Pelagicoccus mobilis TaxID=415221 RepID=A0A934VR14_9BACT|nr:DNA topology modulation protein [Pelagicoccus mobilis]MBK1877069.1 DNA topology modulation protein [Pelagicoccus mobilis]
MERIAIIGSGGAGKTVFAKQLAECLGLPIFHLDKLFWKPNWVESDRDEWRALQEQLCGKPRWIMDGNYGGTMEVRLQACDTVIFIDLPRWLCIFRVLRRIWTYRNRTRPDVTDGCPERFNWVFVRYLWSYPKTRKPQILTRLGELPTETRVYILTSRREVREFLERLK